MSYTISLLDKSPVAPSGNGVDALRTSIRFAQAAEALGYHRLWLAEHHGSPGLAGSAPEILAAHLLAHTRTIRIGTGGVLLQHYSPYKVAEVFKVLSALAPGRVDLGIGKAPGGLPVTARALQAKHGGGQGGGFADQLRDLDGFLDGTLPADHPLQGAVANPQVEASIERFLLGASEETALLAAGLGWNFTFAGHFNGDAESIEKSFAAYRVASGRPPSLAVFAYADTTTARAREAVSHVRIFRLTLPDGRRFNVASLDQASEFARQVGAATFSAEPAEPQVIAGTADEVRRELDRLSRRFGVEEFIIDTPVADAEQRIGSIERIAGRRLTAAA